MKNLVIYHGTTDDVAEKIKREGLKPNRAEAFDIQKEDTFLGIVGLGTFTPGHSLRKEEGNEPLVYVTAKKEIAESFADFRVKFERANVGDIIEWNTWHYKKLGGPKKDNVSPVVLQFELPPTWPLKTDPEFGGGLAKIYRGIIPPKYLKEVIPVKGFIPPYGGF